MSDQSKETKILTWFPAKWTVHEDDDRVTLQIELGNDHAVTLTAYRTFHAYSITMWSSAGEQPFEGDSNALKQKLADVVEGIDPVDQPPAPRRSEGQ
jgi:hypothetical protein